MKKTVVLLLVTMVFTCNSSALILVNFSNYDFIPRNSSCNNDSNTKSNSNRNSNKPKVNSYNQIPNYLLNLYPLEIGNRWILLEEHVINPNVWYEVKTIEVIGDSLASNGKFYYHLKQDDYHYLDRVDSIDGKVYRYFEDPSLPESEYTIADLYGEVGDSFPSFDPIYTTSYSYVNVSQIDTIYKWGLYSIRKTYQQITPGPLHITNIKLTEGIGMESIMTGLPLYGISSVQILKGCVINGIVYGDTTLTNIKEEEHSFKTNYQLCQNYPNPFNPSTKISYQLPKAGNITLKVFDVLGKEVTTLVNEYKNIGRYEIEFNANNLPSGVYFYQLKAGNFVQTKKMILIK